MLCSSVLQVWMCGGEQLQESKIVRRLNQEVEDRLQKEFERLMKMDAVDREAECLRRDITEKILNLCCPRCGQAFIDFDGCCALRCSRCGCGFCAWCLADCGVDAHVHVGGCVHNAMADRQVFAREDIWRKAQETRKMGMVREKLKTVKSPEVRRRVLELLGKEFDISQLT
eukprot:TRINITY_DN39647_c0_g2_i1.p1 TRINITY_DN39647_c0_g2~~TRINITY_DN39647_c0_g2_i1.p1  ORF type:complete len:171 (+),score=28.16 TRINITY_DN39647_c0_g2_i1:312-824(+)